MVAASLAAVSLSSYAQNLDPTVVVNRAYEGKLLEVHKPAMEMAVPDSIQRFDLDFDYSVFENPYKGSYEFTPYQLLLKPLSSDVDMPDLWLNVGAGYTLYPELGLVWTPVKKGPFKMSVYADYNAYFGSYRKITPFLQDNGTMTMGGNWNGKDKENAYWKGHRMVSKAGVDGRYDWEKSAFYFDLGYYGVASKDSLKARSFNAADVSLRIASKPRTREYFYYDVNMAYRFGQDNLKYVLTPETLSEHVLSFGAVLGPSLSSTNRLMFDIGFDAVAYTGFLKTAVGKLKFAPHYIVTNDRWHLDLGVKLEKMFKTEDSEYFVNREQIVYPDVKIRFSAIPEALAVYLNAEGGENINTYSSLLDRNQFVDPYSGRNSALLDAEVERVDLRLGFDGRISKRFTYDLYAGYANYAAMLMDAVGVFGDNYLPGYGYASYQRVYAGLKWDLNADAIRFDGNVEYTAFSRLEQGVGFFAPSALVGDVELIYNWNRRLFAGVDCRFASKRRGSFDEQLMLIPAYADLGAYAEYAFNRKISFWLRGGNLLNMTVQYSPLYAEKGINFTAGIRLKL